MLGRFLTTSRSLPSVGSNSVSTSRSEPRSALASGTLGVVAFGVLIAVFVVDVLTPQRLIVAILLDVPIVMAALTRSRRLTAALVATAISADAVAAFANAAHDGYLWDPVGAGDRLLSMLSIVLVGFLSTAVQERSERVGRLSAQHARARREADLAATADRLRASLSYDLVVRAVVREACGALDAERAFWYPARHDAEVLTARADTDEVAVVDMRTPPEMASLARRVADGHDPVSVAASDPVGRLVLDSVGARCAIAVPLTERGAALGVLIAGLATDVADESALAGARGFATVAENALAQARLFATLADRNEALVQRRDVIRDLVYALSHDLRTPLTALSMTLAQAAGGAYGALPPAYTTVLRDSLVSIEDLRRLAETLLIVARFESGERRPERVKVDLDAVVTEIGSELHAMAEARGISFAVEPDARAFVRGSRGDFKRALANLVSNALEHTPKGGSVRLATTATAQNVEATVTDDGYGIDEHARMTLFQRFGTASTAGGGTGLGLYIVRRIAEEAGGRVSYRPNVPRGSVFMLFIPVARE
jgi:signal transduction histidine kinase